MAVLSSLLSWLHTPELIVLLAIFLIFYITFIQKPWTWMRSDEVHDKLQKDVIGGDQKTEPDEMEGDCHEGEEYSSSHYEMIPYKRLQLSEDDMVQRSTDFYQRMNARRSVRFFSTRPVNMQVVNNIIRTAGTAPSGANQQPWTFAVVRDAMLKTEIRQVVEAEEEINYRRRMGARWVEDVQKLNVDWVKAYLEDAPVLLVVFKHVYEMRSDGSKQTTYYNEISTCIAVGMLLAAIQEAGLSTVTTTPMNAGPALRQLLHRPSNEKVVLLLPLGFAADDAIVPNIHRKPLDQIITVH